ncbi:MAG TPA: S1C family serine protease [Tepidisphaeraceae bacterium]|nr:S1C family serine protease [Tepidisphaeraceae bacterium]
MRLLKFSIRVLVFFGVTGASIAAAGPTTRPMLDQLNRETTSLYQQAQTGIYRVQLPQPKWVNAYAMAAVKHWDKQLDPELRKRLEQDPPEVLQAAELQPGPATQPSEENQTTTIPGQGTYRVVRPNAGKRDAVLGGTLRPQPTTAPGFAPNNLGLLLDGEGHLLVPLYVEREAVGAEAVKVAGPNGEVTAAKFLGSDRQTNLTLLQVQNPAGTAVRLGEARPEIGSLVMCIAPADGSGHLAVWSDGAQENGIVFTTDGEVAGIARFGQFLTGSACRLIERQIVQYGAVKRATLGVLITEIRADDPLRRKQPVLGSKSAMRIDEVIRNSAADRAGLRPGDLVLAIGGEAVSDLPSFAAAIAARTGPTQLQILRGEKSFTTRVDLQQQK